MIIYKATNKINGKFYIGKTIHSLKNRKRKHIWESKKPKHYFQTALKKYGIENFKWEILYTASTKQELNEKEIYYISKLSSNTIGYNLTSGGDCGPVKYGKDNAMYGKKRPEIAKLMSELRKGVPLKEEHKQKIKKQMQKYVGENNPAKRKESRNKIKNKAVKAKIKIEGVIYNGITDVCEKLNMSRSTVKQRLNSKSERFKNWKRIGYFNAENNKRYKENYE